MNVILSMLMISTVLLSSPLQADIVKTQVVTFLTADGGTIEADLYGNGEQAVVLAHGAIFNKESWNDLAMTLAKNGFTVLAINFRSYGKSTVGKEQKALYQDILGAIHFLHKRKPIRQVSVLGASMGGGAAAQAAISSLPGEIDKLILLSPTPVQHPEKLQGNKLYIASRNEAMFDQIKAQYGNATSPKQWLVIDGSAHAQHIFKTNHATALTQAILIFLQTSP